MPSLASILRLLCVHLNRMGSICIHSGVDKLDLIFYRNDSLKSI